MYWKQYCKVRNRVNDAVRDTAYNFFFNQCCCQRREGKTCTSRRCYNTTLLCRMRRWWAPHVDGTVSVKWNATFSLQGFPIGGKGYDVQPVRRQVFWFNRCSRPEVSLGQQARVTRQPRRRHSWHVRLKPSRGRTGSMRLQRCRTCCCSLLHNRHTCISTNFIRRHLIYNFLVYFLSIKTRI